jgi:hypothetical protein
MPRTGSNPGSGDLRRGVAIAGGSIDLASRKDGRQRDPSEERLHDAAAKILPGVGCGAVAFVISNPVRHVLAYLFAVAQ